jgi:DNA-binding beta-propeller fold protein YncE
VTPGRIRSFDLSPDGTRMLVTADGSGRLQPWIVPLDGSEPRLVTVDGAVQRCVWTPDGAQFIALVDPDGREDNQVAVVDVATGSVRLIDAFHARLVELGKTVTYRRIDGAGHDIAQQQAGFEAATLDWLAEQLLGQRR